MNNNQLAEELVKLAEGILKRSRKHFDFDYTIKGKLYNVEIKAYDQDDWVIEDITAYREDSNKTDSLSEDEFKSLESVLENDNKFLDEVSEVYLIKYPGQREYDRA